FGGIECIELLPVKIATVDDAAAAQMEEIGGDLGRFGVPGEHVGIVSGSGGDFLALLHFGEGVKQVAVSGGFFVSFGGGGALHAFFDAAGEIAAAAFEKEANVACGLGVTLAGDEAFDARAEAAMNVKLQAGARMAAREVHRAGRDEKMLVD